MNLLSLLLFFIGSGHAFFQDMTDMMKVVVMKYYVQVFLFVLPDFQKLSMPAKAFTSEFSLGAISVLSAIGDSLFRTALMVALGVLFFRLKEVGTERWE